MPASQDVASGSAPPIAFYFDFISPYAYVANAVLPSVAHNAGRSIEYRPVLFAGLLNAHGQKGPAEIPAKRLYTFKDAYRKAHKRDVELRPPPAHPFNPLLALRVVIAASQQGDPGPLVDLLYRAVWRDGEGVEDPAVVRARAELAGFDGAALLERAASAPVKEELRTSTERAIASGVFGVPTMVTDNELFWGVDAIDHLIDFLDGKDPIAQVDLAAYVDLPSTANRLARAHKD